MIAKRTGAFYRKEILKFATGYEAVDNGVIDATTVSANADSRLVLEAGTVLCQVSASATAKLRPAANSGEVSGDIRGILVHNIEFFGNADSSYDEPCALFFWNAIFDTTQLVKYSGNAAAVKAALPSCSFRS